MTAFDANVNQHPANTSPRNLAVQFYMLKRDVSASCRFFTPTSHQTSMHPSVQCPVPLRIPGYATGCYVTAAAGCKKWQGNQQNIYGSQNSAPNITFWSHLSTCLKCCSRCWTNEVCPEFSTSALEFLNVTPILPQLTESALTRSCRSLPCFAACPLLMYFKGNGNLTCNFNMVWLNHISFLSI